MKSKGNSMTWYWGFDGMVSELEEDNGDDTCAYVEEVEADELRAELTEMFEELLRAYLDWEDVAELRYSEGL